MPDSIGGTITLDISDFTQKIQKVDKLIRENESIWRQSAAALGDWTKSEEGLKGRLDSLSKQIEQQKSVLDLLEQKKQKVIELYGAESSEVDRVNKDIIRYSKQLEKSYAEQESVRKSLEKLTVSQEKDNDVRAESTKDLKKQSDASKTLDDRFKELEKTIAKAGKSFTVLKGVISNLVTQSLNKAVDTVKSFIGLIDTLPQSTERLRRTMITLNTAYTKAGLSAKSAENAYIEFSATLGTVVEDVTSAVTLIGQLSNAEEDLNTWTDILSGTYATVGKTFPINEYLKNITVTASTGKMTEYLRNALVTAGYSAEQFEREMSRLSTRQERQALIMETLNKLYGEAGREFRKANAEIDEGAKAMTRLNLAYAQFGDILQPVKTEFDNSKADILNSLADLLQGIDGAEYDLAYALGYLIGNVVKTFDTVKEALKPAWDKVWESVEEWWGSNKETFKTKVVNGIASIFNVDENTLSDLFTAGIMVSIGAALLKSGSVALGAAGVVGASILSGIITEESVAKFVSETLPDIASKLAVGVIDVINGAFKGLGFDDLPIIGALIDELQKMKEDLQSNAGFLTIAKDIGLAVWNSIYDGVSSAEKGLQGLLDSILSKLGVSEETRKALADGWRALWDYSWEDFGRDLSSWAGNWTEWLSGVKDGAVEAFASMGAWFQEGFDKAVKAIHIGIDWLSNLFDWEAIKEIGANIWNGIVEGMTNAVTGIGKGVEKVGGTVVNAFKSFFGIHSPSDLMADEIGMWIPAGIVEGMEKALPDTEAAVEEVATTIVDEFASGYEAAMKGEQSRLRKAVEEAVVPPSDKPTLSLWERIKAFVRNIKNGWTKYLTMELNKDSSLSDILYSVVIKGIDKAGSALTAFWTSTVPSMLSTASDAMKDATSEYEKKVEDLAKTLRTGDYDKAFQEYGISLSNAVKDGITRGSINSQDVAKQFLGDRADIGADVADSLMNSLISGISGLGGWGALIGQILQISKDALDSGDIDGYFADLLDGLVDGIVRVVDNLPALVRGATAFMRGLSNALVKAIPQLVKSIPTILKELVNGFLQGIPDMVYVGIELVKGIGQGIWESIKSIGNWLWEGIKSVGNWIWNGFKSIFGIHSPSKLMEDSIGKNITLGIAKGITENADAVSRAIQVVGEDAELAIGATGQGVVAGGTVVNQYNTYAREHSRYEIYKSRRQLANAVGATT